MSRCQTPSMKAYSKDLKLKVLVPSLPPGPVVLDNLGAHKGERVRELIEGQGCSLPFLASYSPDFSPIEEAFSKLKALLRKAAASTACPFRDSY